MIFLRSALFALAVVIFTPLYSTLILLTFPFAPRTRTRVISGWARVVLPLARLLCGVRWKVEGLEHLPTRPAVILSNHQSAWETIAFQVIFPPQVYVLKRELLWVPFFGWALALMSPIAINRARGSDALRQVARVGVQRLLHGFWIVIFPEGTRVAPGVRRKYRLGGAFLAAEAKAPVVPVAHNSGSFWPARNFPIRPGLITVRIGRPIPTQGRDPKSINDAAQAWIEAQQASLRKAS